MEEDTGKLTHIGSETGRIAGATGSLIDYNRAGVPLIEIVTKPIEGAGARAPQIARSYVTALRDLLRALGYPMSGWIRARCDAMPMCR
jgi:aspartyl-tRNA(Asn)/glutamyl-tRNA(Gln) amidotransferase subunit B